MFKQRVKIEDLKEESLNELQDGEALQIFCEKESKVVLTLEHYLTLLAKIEKLENR